MCKINVRLSPLAEVFRSGGSPTAVKIPQTWTFPVYRGVATINLLPQNITILSVPWDAGVGETAASGFPSFSTLKKSFYVNYMLLKGLQNYTKFATQFLNMVWGAFPNACWR